jgi:ribosomal protein S18 acetylase RimI-like enzyme
VEADLKPFDDSERHAAMTAISPPYHIRLMRASDIPDALDFWHGAPGVGLSEDADHPAALETFLQANASTCFALCEGDRLIGTVMAGSDGRRGYIYHLAVHSDFQRRGWGRALLRRAVDALGERGISKVHLFVFTANETAIEFYQRIGWSERRDLTVFTQSIPSPALDG